MISYIPKLFLEIITISLIVMIIMIYINLGYDFNQILPNITLYAVCALRMIPSFNTLTYNFTIFKLHSISLNSIYNQFKFSNKEKKKNKLNDSNLLKKIGFFNSITIKNLNFEYDVNKRILSNVSLTINKGDKIGILGKSGSGKSTFVDILMGLHEIIDGSILINNNIDINSNIESWRSKIGYIPQNLYMFDDSIVSNITFGLSKKDIDFENFNKCLKISNLLEFVNNLPMKENTIIGNNGVRISGGEKQRIGIARALYNNPELLIFDELQVH